MASDHHELLAQMGLTDRKSWAMEVSGGETAIAVPISNDEHEAVWERARSQVEKTGRWPVVAYGPSVGSDPSSPPEHLIAVDTSPDPKAIIARAVELDVDRELDRAVQSREGGCVFEYESWEALLALPEPDPGAPIYTRHQGWSVNQGWRLDLILLPIPQPWAAYCYLPGLADWWGCDLALLTAAARRWFSRYAAEPCVISGTDTLLKVGNPPRDFRTALALAREHLYFACDTLWKAGVAPAEHARALMVVDRWSLWAGA